MASSAAPRAGAGRLVPDPQQRNDGQWHRVQVSPGRSMEVRFAKWVSGQALYEARGQGSARLQKTTTSFSAAAGHFGEQVRHGALHPWVEDSAEAVADRNPPGAGSPSLDSLWQSAQPLLRPVIGLVKPWVGLHADAYDAVGKPLNRLAVTVGARPVLPLSTNANATASPSPWLRTKGYAGVQVGSKVLQAEVGYTDDARVAVRVPDRRVAGGWRIYRAADDLGLKGAEQYDLNAAQVRARELLDPRWRGISQPIVTVLPARLAPRGSSSSSPPAATSPQPERMPKDTVIELPARTDIVDTDSLGQPVRFTSPSVVGKPFTIDVTARVQPVRVTLPWGAEVLGEIKPASTLGQYGADIKYKINITDALPPQLASVSRFLRSQNCILELEYSTATRFIHQNGQWLAQGGVSFKINNKGKPSQPWRNLVLGLELPQVRGDLFKFISRIVPYAASLVNLTSEGLQQQAEGRPLSAEYTKRFNHLAAHTLAPIMGTGGQVSIVYPVNALLEKIPVIGDWAKKARTASGFNSRVGMTFSLRDSTPKVSTSHVDGNDTADLYTVAVDPRTQRRVGAQRVDFAKEFFGSQGSDPGRSELATSAFVAGFNEFQVASLLPLPRPAVDRAGTDAQTFARPDPAPHRYGSAQASTAVEGFISPAKPKTYRPDDRVQVLADQVASALADLQAHLPANAGVALARLPLNGHADACAAVAQAIQVARGLAVDPKSDNLVQRFASLLSNPHGVDWGLEEVRAENLRRHGAGTVASDVQAALERSDRSRWVLRDKAQGGTAQEQISLRSGGGADMPLVLTDWQDNQGRRHLGVVPPGVSAFEVKTGLDAWTAPSSAPGQRLAPFAQARRAIPSSPVTDALGRGVLVRGWATELARAFRPGAPANAAVAAVREVLRAKPGSWPDIAQAAGGWRKLAEGMGSWKTLARRPAAGSSLPSRWAVGAP